MVRRETLINTMIRRASTFKPLSPDLYWVIVHPESLDDAYGRNLEWGRVTWIDLGSSYHRKPSIWHGFRLFQSYAFPIGEIGFATPPELVEGDL